MKKKITSTLQNLRELKRKLDSEQMSVLVGAGFGKNIVLNFVNNWGKRCLISFGVYYRMYTVLRIGYLLSSGSKMCLLPKLNFSFLCL